MTDRASGTDPRPERSPLRIAAAASVHLFTATGAVWAWLAVRALEAHEWQLVFVWLAVAVLVDGLDGTFARMADVKRVMPGFDGALLDNLVDYLTYVFVPALFFGAAGLVPEGWGFAVAAVVLLSSAYQFCQSDAKTDDHCFKGFPSYWNLLAFYLFVLDLPARVNVSIIALCAVLVFVPVKYAYPSRMTRYRRSTLILTALWGAALVAMLVLYPKIPGWLMAASLAYVVYYLVLSAGLTLSSLRNESVS